jgi:hypothetical protein
VGANSALEPGQQAACIPALAAYLLDLRIERIDQRGDGQRRDWTSNVQPVVLHDPLRRCFLCDLEADFQPFLRGVGCRVLNPTERTRP